MATDPSVATWNREDAALPVAPLTERWAQEQLYAGGLRAGRTAAMERDREAWRAHLTRLGSGMLAYAMPGHDERILPRLTVRYKVREFYRTGLLRGDLYDRSCGL